MGHCLSLGWSGVGGAGCFGLFLWLLEFFKESKILLGADLDLSFKWLLMENSL